MPPDSGSRGAGGGRFWVWFFGTIGLIVTAVAVMLALALRHIPSAAEVEAAQRRADALLARWGGEGLARAFPATDATIEAAVERAFRPAYDNIEAFADLHYSVAGEYLELYHAASGQLAEQLAARLLEGLDRRLAVARGEVGATLLVELQRKLSDALAEDARGLALPGSRAFDAAVELAVQDTLSRFEAGDLALRLGASGLTTVAGAAAAKTIPVAIAKKLSAVTAAKVAGKTAVKASAGAAVGAASGAAVGSVVPGAGTALGGIVGGIIGWLAVDKLVIEVAEYWGRDEFEAELARLIDEQRGLTVAGYRSMVEAGIRELGGSTPLDLIRVEGSDRH